MDFFISYVIFFILNIITIPKPLNGSKDSRASEKIQADTSTLESERRSGGKKSYYVHQGSGHENRTLWIMTTNMHSAAKIL